MSKPAQTIHAILQEQFYLPTDIILQHLDTHYLLHWQGKYLVSQMDSIKFAGDIISRNSINYKVFYLDDLYPWKILTQPEDQYMISFRKLACASTGVALIKKAQKVGT